MAYIEELVDHVVTGIRFGMYNRTPSSVYKHLTPTHDGSSQPFVVVVNPASVEDTRSTRCKFERSVEIRVIVRDYIPVRGDADITNGQSAEAEDLLTVCEQIKSHLWTNYNKYTANDGTVFMLNGVVHSPIYDYSALLEDSTFVSIISLTYKGYA